MANFFRNESESHIFTNQLKSFSQKRIERLTNIPLPCSHGRKTTDSESCHSQHLLTVIVRNQQRIVDEVSILKHLGIFLKNRQRLVDIHGHRYGAHILTNVLTNKRNDTRRCVVAASDTSVSFDGINGQRIEIITIFFFLFFFNNVF